MIFISKPALARSRKKYSLVLLLPVLFFTPACAIGGEPANFKGKALLSQQDSKRSSDALEELITWNAGSTNALQNSVDPLSLPAQPSALLTIDMLVEQVTANIQLDEPYPLDHLPLEPKLWIFSLPQNATKREAGQTMWNLDVAPANKELMNEFLAKAERLENLTVEEGWDLIIEGLNAVVGARHQPEFIEQVKRRTKALARHLAPLAYIFPLATQEQTSPQLLVALRGITAYSVAVTTSVLEGDDAMLLPLDFMDHDRGHVAPMVSGDSPWAAQDVTLGGLVSRSDKAKGVSYEVPSDMVPMDCSPLNSADWFRCYRASRVPGELDGLVEAGIFEGIMRRRHQAWLQRISTLKSTQISRPGRVRDGQRPPLAYILFEKGRGVHIFPSDEHCGAQGKAIAQRLLTAGIYGEQSVFRPPNASQNLSDDGLYDFLVLTLRQRSLGNPIRPLLWPSGSKVFP